MILGLSISRALEMYPEMTYYDNVKKREVTDMANKYFLMYGDTVKAPPLHELRLA